MAIIEGATGLEVTVRINEQPLQEYECPDGQDKEEPPPCPTVVRYIECVDDAEFDVCIIVHPSYAWGYRDHALSCPVAVDGKRVRNSLIRSSDSRSGNPITRLIRGQKSGPDNLGTWHLHKFKFSVVKTVDDAPKERVEKDRKVAQGLGTIEVEFTRTIEQGHVAIKPRAGADLAGFELAEKSLKGKAVSHGTSYQTSKPIPAPTWIETRHIAEDNGPIAVFRFLYRSREALRRELIIPRTPSRSPSLGNLTAAERDRLARERLQELRNSKMKREKDKVVIKREFGEVFDLTQDGPGGSGSNKRRHGEVIDLTDD